MTSLGFDEGAPNIKKKLFFVNKPWKDKGEGIYINFSLDTRRVIKTDQEKKKNSKT